MSKVLKWLTRRWIKGQKKQELHRHRKMFLMMHLIWNLGEKIKIWKVCVKVIQHSEFAMITYITSHIISPGDILSG